MPIGKNYIVIFSTAPAERVAVKIANALVKKGLIACANIVPKIRSIYRWKKRIYDEHEVQIVMKSTVDKLEAVKKELKKLHPYECPELVAIPIVGGLKAYLDWIDE